MPRALCAAVASCCLLVPSAAAAPRPAPPPRVLVLSADPAASAGLAVLSSGLRQVLSDSISPEVEVSIENLDLVYFGIQPYQTRLAQLIHDEYTGREPDLLITVGRGATRFALEQRANLFPDAPLLLEVEPHETVVPPAPADVASVVSSYGHREALELALRLLPDTRRVVVILGSGPAERSIELGAWRDLAPLRKRVPQEWWIGVPMGELDARVAQLPLHTIVLYIGIYRDNNGGTFTPPEALERLARRSAAPIFGTPRHWAGRGVVGDGRYDVRQVGLALGRQAVRLLHGEPGATVGSVRVPPAPPLFDGRQLDRWHISRDRLPPGAEVSFETSPWQLYRWWILLALTVMGLQAALITGLGVERLGRRRAERQQRRLLNRSQSVFASVQERVLVIDRDGLVVAANDAWKARGGALSPVIVQPGQNYLAVLRAAVSQNGPQARHGLEAIGDVLAGATLHARVEYSEPGSHDDEKTWYEMNVVALEGEEPGAAIAISDITDRRRAETRLRSTLESLPVPTLLLGPGGAIELINAEVVKLLGFARESLLGRPASVVCEGIDEHLSRLLGTWAGQAGPHPLVTEPEILCRREDGSHLAVQLRLRPLLVGKRTVVLASFTDLTERRRFEGEMRMLRAEMAHFARVATVGEMSAAITHELNQPLTGILTNSQAALRYLASGKATFEDVQEVLADVVADSRRAGEVIHRLRALLRKGPVELQPLDVNQVVRQVTRLVSQDMALRDSVLDLELASELPMMQGDRVQIQQVILNLVLNAVDSMAAKDRDQRRVLVRTAPGSGHAVEIQVRDAGTGIAAEVMGRLFEPFFTTKANGMGMGLSIVRSIVESHHGRIDASNNPSGGATFTIILPALQSSVFPGEAA